MTDGYRSKQVKGRKVRVVAVSGPPVDMRDRYERIQWALDTILKESEGNGGIYPTLGRKPTLSNVLLRAGLPRSFLETRSKVPSARDKRNAILKTEINEKLGKVREKSLPISDCADEPEREMVRKLKDGWHKAELNLVQAKADIAKLREQLSLAEKENLQLRESVSLPKI